MSIDQNLHGITSILDELSSAEVIDNTFGKVYSINNHLEAINRAVSTQEVNESLAKEIVEVTTRVEDSRWLFGIPEQHLIDRVLSLAETLRNRFEDRE